jgi:hypothetical protein
MTVSSDLIQQLLDTNYPRAMTPAALATRIGATVPDVQTALNLLVRINRAVLTNATTSQYQGTISIIYKKLISIAPQSTTAANIAAQLKLDPNTVQTDLDRLVILGQATNVVLPITGVVQYAWSGK